MRIRRTFAAVIAAAALAGLGLTGAATASAAPTVAVTENPTPGECIDGGGKVGANNICEGGTRNGELVD